MNVRSMTILALFSVFVGLCSPWGLAVQAGTAATEAATEASGATRYNHVRGALDSLAEAMAALELKFMDVRISPVIRAENFEEVPIEVGFMAPETKLVPALAQEFAYAQNQARFILGALNVSVSAETLADGHPLLSITTNQKLYIGNQTEWESLLERNQRLTNALTKLLGVTTFKPQIRKGEGAEKTGPGDTWITNLRIDSDFRVQITGYALEAKPATKLGADLLATGAFSEVYLTSMTRAAYEKVPVYRLDLVARLP
jgi:hypothetical protein